MVGGTFAGDDNFYKRFLELIVTGVVPVVKVGPFLRFFSFLFFFLLATRPNRQKNDSANGCTALHNIVLHSANLADYTVCGGCWEGGGLGCCNETRFTE